MKTFNVIFTRQFEVQVEADNIETAGKLAQQIIAKMFPPDVVTKLVSVAEGEAAPTLAAIPDSEIEELLKEAMRRQGHKSFINHQGEEEPL